MYHSATEARWACFFAALGLTYAYEARGFHLPGANWRYTPDFYLPMLGWVEIKGEPLTAVERGRCTELAGLVDDAVYALISAPWGVGEAAHEGFVEGQWQAVDWRQCHHCGWIHLVAPHITGCPQCEKGALVSWRDVPEGQLLRLAYDAGSNLPAGDGDGSVEHDP